MIPTWRVAAVALGTALLGGVLLGSCWPAPGPERDWRREAEAALRQAQAHEAALASLRQQAQRAEAEANAVALDVAVAQRRAARAEGQVAALKGQLAEAQTAGDSVPVLVAVVAAQDSNVLALEETLRFKASETTALRMALATSYTLADSLTVDRDRWKARVQEGLRVMPKPCRILGMACPSRTTMFVVGAVVGAGAFVALGR